MHMECCREKYLTGWAGGLESHGLIANGLLSGALVSRARKKGRGP